MPSFMDTDDKIELNEKRLQFEYDRYEKYYSRFTLVSILYSILAIYLIQLARFCFSEGNNLRVIYCLLFGAFLACLAKSGWHAIGMLMPRDVSFQQTPKEFYHGIRAQYEQIGITEEEELNEYIKASYNSQLEDAVAENAQLCMDKGKQYFLAFRYALYSIVPYLLCTSIYLYNSEDKPSEIIIANYERMASYNDSVSNSSCDVRAKQLDSLYLNIMSKKDTVVKIDDKKVIKPKPLVVKEGETVKIQK